MPVQRFAPMTKEFATMKVPASGSHETRRWRKVDSNPRSPVRKIYANTEIAAAREQRGRRSAGE
jgi:hypothetical protein